MLFLFKKKKVVLDCFTSRADVFSYFPLQRASKNMPDWWKKLPNTFSTNGLFEFGTMKGCAGFIDFYSSAISIPLWTDTILRTTENEDLIEWFFADLCSNAIPHDPHQKGEYLNDGFSRYTHLKLGSPWVIKCKEDIQFVFSGNPWVLNNPEQVIIPPGVVNFKYQHTTNINMFIRMNGVQKTKLEAGLSLVHLFPMTEREVEIKNHFVDEKEYSKIEKLGTMSFTHKSYNKHKQIRKDAEKTSKCPFSSVFRR